MERAYYVFKYVFLFVVGGVLFNIVEILWRGYSYPSMTVVGGLAFIIVGLLNEIFPWNMSLISQMFISAVVITVLELVAGLILNQYLHLNIWDYSNQSYNFAGQICLLYSNLWFILSLAGIFLDDLVRWYFFGEEIPKYKLF